jgi:hypothetical protein
VADATARSVRLPSNVGLLSVLPHLFVERLDLGPQPLVVVNAVPLAKPFDRSLDQRIVGFVFSAPACAEVPEVIAQENVGLRVIGMLAEVVDEML